ncbi:MAG: TrkH family potassium uptake protein [Candidatus Eisenbacteria bacterium]|uniref:TrkH family potassium uptake protein n=1 Tax=Eiseniibacteriota bacterium TaxID=2212470 RepID=A0A948RUB7_UNCEI|nr:TrkH family potassium uptake protein [Candidatus Eisenbacteria bacterium]MBU1950160.1 TrkH family potassium uptake protein [Candidatus Eisenbacteria bacterium]MBU2689612.1 TrkH family potassium uptake protein [Candidatus Eisenbacteria bacterium]
MNYTSVIRFLGALCVFLGATMILPLAWAIGLHEDRAIYGLVISIGFCLLFGGTLFFAGHREHDGLHRKEGFAVVGLGWILAALVGALPYILSGAIHDPINAVFETMSGFTTTGSSILDNVESLPRSILFWRDFTHWLGGMGIIVLFIAVLPHLGVGARYLFRSEIPGAVKDAVTPRVKDTARFLYLAYSLLTAVEILLLRIAGMNWLESCCHTFGTMATGGFSTRQASVGDFHSVWIEAIIIVFMVLAGTNFALYRPFVRRQPGVLFGDREWRAYVGMLGLVSALIALDLIFGHQGLSIGRGIRESVFQVVSIATTTGFVTTDFDQWSSFAKMILFTLMFIGGCSGSTAGAMKVMRVVVLIKFGWAAVHKIFRPHAVTSMRLGNQVLNDEIVNEILAFFVLFLGIFLISSLILAVMGLDLISSFSAVAANLGNVGPGLGSVGASETYSALPALGKILLTVCMLLGRLEIYTILVLFSPVFWRR